MTVRLDDDARRWLALFADVTGAAGRDCISQDDGLVVVVASGEMAEAIGPGGEHVRRFEERIDRPVRLVEYADRAETFVANALAPAAVEHVTLSEADDTVAYVEVPDGDRGVAIGAGGRTIEAARRLAKRHFGIDDVQLS